MTCKCTVDHLLFDCDAPLPQTREMLRASHDPFVLKRMYVHSWPVSLSAVSRVLQYANEAQVDEPRVVRILRAERTYLNE